MKVVKFGGSSLASGAQLEKGGLTDPSPLYRPRSVFPVPIRRRLSARDQPSRFETETVIERYAAIARELNLDFSIIERIRSDLFALLNSCKTNPEQYMDAVKASGEDNIIEKSRFSSRAMAAYRSMTVSASSGAAPFCK
jgi:aspartate kinase